MQGRPSSFFAYVESEMVATDVLDQEQAEEIAVSVAIQKADRMGRSVDIRIGQICWSDRLDGPELERRTVARFSVDRDGNRGKQSRRRNAAQRQRRRELHDRIIRS